MVNGYSDLSNGDARGRVRDERSVLTGNDVLIDVDNTEGMSLVMQKVKEGTQLTEIKKKLSTTIAFFSSVVNQFISSR